MRKRNIDLAMLGITGLLIIVGLAILASASLSLGEEKFASRYYFLYRQIIFGVGLGSILFLAALNIPIHFYKRWAPFLLIASLFLVLLVFTPGVGLKVGDTRRWLQIGPLTFQPSELLKFTFVIYLAAWINSRKKEMSSYTLGFIPFLMITGFVGFFLVAEPDIGTLGVLTLTSLLMFFVGGGRLGQIIIAIFIGLVLLSFLIYFEPYRRSRFFTFLNPEVETLGRSYQINQSFIAIGSGGIFGKGWGLSRQKFQYLPEPAGDAIFAVFAEEMGLIGVIFLFGLFLAFTIRGMIIAKHARDYFSAILATGITLLVVVQVFINVGAITGVLPLTGIPLPFISYGGSALAVLLFEVGVLIKISRKTL